MLHEGLVIPIEPPLSPGSPLVGEAADGWALVAAHGNRSAQFGHPIVVTRGQPLGMTLH